VRERALVFRVVRTPALSLTLGIGAAAGLMSGLFGVGGGLILVPGLVLLIGMSQHRAHATSLAAIIATAPAAAVGFAVADRVAYGAAGVIAVGAIVGAFLGAGLMHRLSDERLAQGFSVLIVLVAVRLLAGGDMDVAAAAGALDLGRGAGFALLGIAAGALSAVMGVGGGVILVPALVLLFGFDQHLAEGTSLLVIVPTAMMGAWRHTRNGYTDWRVGLIAGAGGVVGGLAGAQAALAMDALWLQRLFAIFLIVIGLRMFRRR
jgi:uncharacterized protein